MRRRGAEEEEAQGGLSGGDLVASAWSAYGAARRGAGIHVHEEEGEDEEIRGAFGVAVSGIVLALERAEEAETPLSVSELAHSAYESFVGYGDTKPAADARAHLIWRAVCRHTANCLQYDSDDHGDLSSHEEGWQEWVAHQLVSQGIP